jgi:hypothetical protein
LSAHAATPLKPQETFRRLLAAATARWDLPKIYETGCSSTDNQVEDVSDAERELAFANIQKAASYSTPAEQMPFPSD